MDARLDFSDFLSTLFTIFHVIKWKIPPLMFINLLSKKAALQIYTTRLRWNSSHSSYYDRTTMNGHSIAIWSYIFAMYSEQWKHCNAKDSNFLFFFIFVSKIFQIIYPHYWINLNWHELWKLEKCLYLAPPRGIFYKTQWASKGVKLTWLISIFTFKKVWKFLIKIQLTKFDPKITRR